MFLYFLAELQADGGSLPTTVPIEVRQLKPNNSEI